MIEEHPTMDSYLLEQLINRMQLLAELLREISKKIDNLNSDVHKIALYNTKR